MTHIMRLTYNDMIEYLKQAKEPSRELDWMLLSTITQTECDLPRARKSGILRPSEFPCYTENVDYARPWVPSGYTWCLVDFDHSFGAEVRKSGVGTHIDWPNPHTMTYHVLPAIALWIAILDKRRFIDRDLHNKKSEE